MTPTTDENMVRIRRKIENLGKHDMNIATTKRKQYVLMEYFICKNTRLSYIPPKKIYRQERSCRILNMCQKTHVRSTEKAIEMNLPAKYQYKFLLHQHAVQNYVAE